MLPLFTTDHLNAIAPGWLAAQAALVQGTLALAFVACFWALFRRHISHAFHGLFLLVSVKTAAAFLFVAWPVAISFQVPLPQQLVAFIQPPAKLLPLPRMALNHQIQPLESLTDQPRPELNLLDLPEVVASAPLAFSQEASETRSMTIASVVCQWVNSR
jgi:hypothetical protein